MPDQKNGPSKKSPDLAHMKFFPGLKKFFGGKSSKALACESAPSLDSNDDMCDEPLTPSPSGYQTAFVTPAKSAKKTRGNIKKPEGRKRQPRCNRKLVSEKIVTIVDRLLDLSSEPIPVAGFCHFLFVFRLFDCI